MTEKYEDLTTRISDDLESTIAGEAYIRNALRWLDDHPDQVPGRAITESTERDLYHAAQHGPHQFRDALIDHRICVTPAPEPTNAEKLDKIMEEWPGRATASDPTFGEYLHNRGVKAPGGDE